MCELVSKPQGVRVTIKNSYIGRPGGDHKQLPRGDVQPDLLRHRGRGAAEQRDDLGGDHDLRDVQQCQNLTVDTYLLFKLSANNPDWVCNNQGALVGPYATAVLTAIQRHPRDLPAVLLRGARA